MKISACYFSGTGNTKMVAEEAAKVFTQLGHTAELINIDSGEADVTGCDILGIFYPVHAFNAPVIVLDFVKKLAPSDTKKKVFIMKTSGEPLKLNNISSLKIKKILKKKNYILTNEYHYVMPYNIIFRHSDAMAYRMWNTAKQLIPIDCKEILSGKESRLGYVFLGSFIAWIMRIEYFAGKVNGKRYKVTQDCINCNKCVNNCPVNNITVKDGKITFGKDCIMCMRCSFSCPVNAIKIGLFEGWKVNGAYSFKYTEEDDTQSHKNFCKKSYAKYFAKAESKIKGVKTEIIT
ncbi:MAG: EFR1 family ferrodoxin [Clostridia bacterium]|nr:EFR1 family ferrodoxin [Clostridia bacterium]